MREGSAYLNLLSVRSASTNTEGATILDGKKSQNTFSGTFLAAATSASRPCITRTGQGDLKVAKKQEHPVWGTGNRGRSPLPEREVPSLSLHSPPPKAAKEDF